MMRDITLVDFYGLDSILVAKNFGDFIAATLTKSSIGWKMRDCSKWCPRQAWNMSNSYNLAKNDQHKKCHNRANLRGGDKKK